MGLLIHQKHAHTHTNCKSKVGIIYPRKGLPIRGDVTLYTHLTSLNTRVENIQHSKLPIIVNYVHSVCCKPYIKPVCHIATPWFCVGTGAGVCYVPAVYWPTPGASGNKKKKKKKRTATLEMCQRYSSLQSTRFLVACLHSTIWLCDPGLCNLMGARGCIMLLVWLGASASVCSCSPCRGTERKPELSHGICTGAALLRCCT